MHTSIVGRDRGSMLYYCCKTPHDQALTDRPVPCTLLHDGRLCDAAAAAPGATLEEWLRHG